MSEELGEWDLAEPPAEDRELRRLADLLQDAEGELRVAQAKAAEFHDDESKAQWQRVAANEDAERAARNRDRAAEALAEGQVASASSPSSETASSEHAVQPYYGSVDEFFREYLRLMYTREISGRGSGRVWRADWWRVPEAIARLDALWRSWEQLRLDGGTGASVWWRDHADHHMAVLMDTDGPFKGSTDSCRRGEPLPHTPPPAGLFPDERSGEAGA